ncbi:MAG: hypothetical protein IJD58_13335 [Lachnospiraceae bacterium]|nr:hypothetical protein [Lachnospiraceae bacterium]
MTALIDRIIIFLLSILLLKVEQVDYLTVCLILVVIISICINIYYENKIAVRVASIIYIAMCIAFPQFSCFMPIIVYECGKREYNIYVPFHMIMGICGYLSYIQGESEVVIIAKITLFMAIGYVFGVRSYKDEVKDNIIHNLQDEESYLRQSNRQKQDDLLRNQDFEIHAATLAERNRIAREIHDHVGHMISRALLQLGAIMAINKDEKTKEPLMALKGSLDTAMNNIRESVHDIKDEALDLEYMINDIVKEYDNLNIELDYDMSKYAAKELKYCYVAIIKEALTNTVKHSNATKVQIVVREHPALYQLLIEDNGTVTDKKKNDTTGIGLDNMRERVSAFKGNMLVTKETGFKIFISIPKEN